MPSQKFTLRLPPPLATAVHEHLSTTGMLFAALARAALSAYLADTPPTGAGSPADTPADRLQALHEALEALTRRVETLERRPTPRRQRADTGRQATADRQPTGADRQELGYDPARYVLGRLCPRGHEYQRTGQTLRRRTSNSCPQCDTEMQRQRRGAARRD